MSVPDGWIVGYAPSDVGLARARKVREAVAHAMRPDAPDWQCPECECDPDECAKCARAYGGELCP